MKIVVCSIRDRAADVFSQPFFQPSLGTAIRGFSDAVNGSDATSALVSHPEDFDLFHLGYFDDEIGRFENLELPKQVAIGKDVKIVK